MRRRERKLYAAVATEVTAEGNAHVVPKLIFARNGDVLSFEGMAPGQHSWPPPAHSVSDARWTAEPIDGVASL